jgi:uncharacterized membrane protein YdbT with pleckstrin-like domain
MSYYAKVLRPDETVRAVGRIHWVVYLKAWALLLIGLAAAIAYFALRQPAVDDAADGWQPGSLRLGAAAVVAVVFLAVGLVQFLSAWIRRTTTEIAITDRRIIFKQGFLRRRTMEMNMNKVETVDVLQSIPGRLLNYGTIIIRGTGSSYEPLRLINNPIIIRTAIVAQ